MKTVLNLVNGEINHVLLQDVHQHSVVVEEYLFLELKGGEVRWVDPFPPRLRTQVSQLRGFGLFIRNPRNVI